MRIPPSVIVMSLLTAAPFGLAIRDTLTKKQPAAEEDEWTGYGHTSRQDRDALAEYEAEMQREAEERAAKRKQQVARLDELFGRTPASMGPLLHGVTLGAAADTISETALDRIQRAAEDGFLEVSLGDDEQVVRGVTISLDARDYDSELGAVVDLCDPLHEKLVAAWGPSTNGVWRDEVTRQRASLDRESCVLSFDKYLPVDVWVKSVLAVDVGKPADNTLKAYTAALGIELEENEEDVARWSLPGLGAAAGGTEVMAMIDQKGKIAGVRAVVEADFDTAVAMRDVLSEALKVQPKRDEDAEQWVWKRKPAVTLTQYDGSDRLILLVGKDPWE
jgi:hypothetical protein